MTNQDGRVIVITGANTGLGARTAVALAARGAHVALAVRDLARGQVAATNIRDECPTAEVSVHELDLSSLASVTAAAHEIARRHPVIDVLVNNAGVSASTAGTTDDGFELHLGVNHLGHFALTGLLLGPLLAAPAPRVVSVSSSTHRARGADRFSDLTDLHAGSQFSAYGRSKLANLLFTYALQRRLAGSHALAVAAHPGGSATDLMRSATPAVRLLAGLALQSPDMGALPTLRAATDPGVLGGQFYGPDGWGQVRGFPQVVTSNARSYDLGLQEWLWTASEKATGVSFPSPGGARTIDKD